MKGARQQHRYGQQGVGPGKAFVSRLQPRSQLPLDALEVELVRCLFGVELRVEGFSRLVVELALFPEPVQENRAAVPALRASSRVCAARDVAPPLWIVESDVERARPDL